MGRAEGTKDITNEGTMRRHEERSHKSVNSDLKLQTQTRRIKESRRVCLLTSRSPKSWSKPNTSYKRSSAKKSLNTQIRPSYFRHHPPPFCDHPTLNPINKIPPPPQRKKQKTKNRYAKHEYNLLHEPNINPVMSSSHQIPILYTIRTPSVHHPTPSHERDTYTPDQ